MTDTVDRAERLTNVLALLLSTSVPLTAEHIFDELEGQYPAGSAARRQAFERDKSSLRDIGVPIETTVLSGDDAGRTGYRIDRRRYELTELDLLPDETHALQLAVAAIRSDTPIGTEALLKLGAGAPDASGVVGANVPALAVLPDLSQAVSRRRLARFEYRGTSRRLDPWGLALRDGFWYVVGFDHGHGEVRTYRVDRIEGTVQVDADAVFERPDVDVPSLLPQDPKLLGTAGDPGAADTALVHLDAGAVHAGLVEELGEDRVVRRGSDGSVDVIVPCVNLPAFRSWVLGFLDAAEVVTPTSARDDIVAWIDSPATIGVEAARDELARRPARRPSTASAGAAATGRGRADQRVRRMLLMLPWLAERGEVPLDEVAERFDLAPDEVEFDIAWVSLCGLPPYVDEMIDVFVDEGMVYVGVPRLFTRPLRLTAPEGFALLTAGRAAMALPGADPVGPLGRGLAKLAATLGEDDAGVVVDLARPAIADELVDAVRRAERVRIVYWSANSDAVTERVVTPRRLFADRGHWYLRAADHHSGESRTFRLDRIESHRRLGEFDDAEVDAQEEEWFADASIARATLCLRPAAYWVTERYPVDDAFDSELDCDLPGRQRVRFVRLAVSSERWLARLLVRLGPDAAVVEPAIWEHIADPVRARIRARYS